MLTRERSGASSRGAADGAEWGRRKHRKKTQKGVGDVMDPVRFSALFAALREICLWSRGSSREDAKWAGTANDKLPFLRLLEIFAANPVVLREAH